MSKISQSSSTRERKQFNILSGLDIMQSIANCFTCCRAFCLLRCPNVLCDTHGWVCARCRESLVNPGDRGTSSATGTACYLGCSTKGSPCLRGVTRKTLSVQQCVTCPGERHLPCRSRGSSWSPGPRAPASHRHSILETAIRSMFSWRGLQQSAQRMEDFVKST